MPCSNQEQPARVTALSPCPQYSPVQAVRSKAITPGPGVSMGLCALPPFPFMTSDKLLYLSEPQFPFLKRKAKQTPLHLPAQRGNQPQSARALQNACSLWQGERENSTRHCGCLHDEETQAESWSQGSVFPEAGSVHQTLNKLVSREGILVLDAEGAEQRHIVNGDPPSPAPHQHSSSPGRAGGTWKEIFGPPLAGEVGCSGDALRIHVRHSFRGAFNSKTM